MSGGIPYGTHSILEDIQRGGEMLQAIKLHRAGFIFHKVGSYVLGEINI